jgi:hypothetical protein
MAPYDPNVQPNGSPPNQPPPEPPPEQGGQEVPNNPLSAPMASAMKQATPEEQADLERFVGRAWQLIYDDATFPHIVEMLKGGAGPAAPMPGGPPPEQGPPPDQAAAPPNQGAPPPDQGVPPPDQAPPGGPPGEATGDPVKGLAQATDLVVARVGQAAEDSGQPLQPDVVFHAAGDILEELAEISRRAKIKDYSKDPDALETAWFQALDMYRERLQQAGVIDQGHAQADLDRLIAADKDGTYEKIMRDLAASDNSGQAGGPDLSSEEKKEPKPKGFGKAMGI